MAFIARVFHRRAVTITAKLVFLVLSSSAAIAADQPASPIDKPGWVLDVNDEFNGSTLNTSLWSPYFLQPRVPEERSIAEYVLANGLLTLQISSSHLTYRPNETIWVSGIQTGQRNGLHKPEIDHSVPTTPLYVPRYGYFEVRAKQPASAFSGHHTAYWTVGWHEKASQSGEFDMSEDAGNNSTDRTAFNVYPWGDTAMPGQSGTAAVPGANLTSEFHIYALEWTPTSYKFTVDGTVYRQSTTYSPAYPMVFFLTLFRGADFTGPLAEGENVNAPFTTKEYVIDYFRAYRRPSATILVDNDIHDPHGYRETGVWSASNLAGIETSTTRFADWDGTVKTATWTPNLWEAGDYHVEVNYPAGTGSVSDATYSILHNGVTNNVTVDQRSNGGSWRRLGTYYFASGKSGHVKLSTKIPALGSGSFRADAARFVRVTDLYWNGLELSGPRTGDLTGWTQQLGTWNIAGTTNRYMTHTANASVSLATQGNPTLADYFVTADIKFATAGPAAGVVGRVSNSNNYYMLRLNQAAGKLDLIKLVNGSATTLASISQTVALNTSYTLKLAMQGSTLKGYLNGVQKFGPITDTSLASGQFGVRTFNGSAQYDNIGQGNNY
jgi:hypothetical protein